MRVADLDLIRCPYCGGNFRIKANYSSFKDELEFAIVECSCAQFPVTKGILNLGGKWGIGLKEAMAYLEKKEFEKACQAQMELESLPLDNPLRILRKLSLKEIPLARILTLISRQLKGKSLSHSNNFTHALKIIGENPFHTYLRQRFSLPSFYKAMPLVIFVQEQHPEVILDLGCGAGHFSMVLDKLCPQSKLISIDQYYIYLYLAKKFLTPRPCYICHNATHKSPVRLKTADVIYCSDMLKYQMKREEVVNNYRDVLSDQGFFVGPRIDEDWLATSVLFDLKSWKQIFNRFYFSMLSEDCLEKEYHDNNSIRLSDVTIDKPACNHYRSLSIIASKNKEKGLEEIKNISEKFSESSFAWALHPQYEISFKRNNHETIYLLNKDKIIFPDHSSELRSFLKNVLPNEIVIPDDALEKGNIIKRHFKGLPDLIRLGVAHMIMEHDL